MEDWEGPGGGLGVAGSEVNEEEGEYKADCVDSDWEDEVGCWVENRLSEDVVEICWEIGRVEKSTWLIYIILDIIESILNNKIKELQ